MDESAPRNEKIWSIIALEASVFFSLTAWHAIANFTWPAGNPQAFFAGIVIGAGAALVQIAYAGFTW